MKRQRSVKGTLRNMSERNRVLLLSVVTGLSCGLAAALLSGTIHFLHRILTSWIHGGAGNFFYLLFPGVGMLLSLLIVKYLVKDNIGHGVTKVLRAISKNESRIAPHNTWSSLLTSALTIGFGGSVGAEAPIVYTGAAIGSNFARYLGLSYRSMTILLGCGAAGAISGIFKAPLAGVLFTLEVLLFNMSMTSMIPLLLSTVSAATVSYLLLGTSLPFECTLSPFDMGNMPFYIVLGVFSGFVSLYFMRTALWMEDRISLIRNDYTKWILCALGLGLLIFLFPPLYGEGYEYLSPLLNGTESSYDGQTLLSGMLHHKWSVPLFFLLILVFKVFSMTFTNAGGGVGGTFGPTLFSGAIAGFVLARGINLIFEGSGVAVPEQNFVLVGMAGVMAGVMQAPLTAMFLIAELSGGYTLLIPLMITATFSYICTNPFEKYSVYTRPLAEKGNLKTHNKDRFALKKLQWQKILDTNISTIPAHSTLRTYTDAIAHCRRNLFVVVKNGNIFSGLLVMDDHPIQGILQSRMYSPCAPKVPNPPASCQSQPICLSLERNSRSHRLQVQYERRQFSGRSGRHAAVSLPGMFEKAQLRD